MLKSLTAFWQRPRSKSREAVETMAIALVLAFFVRTEVAQAFFIPSESMVPTLQVGDRLFVEKLTTHLENLHRGEIIVFDPPERAHAHSGDAWIKRLIALPGETVDIRHGTVYIDGRPLNEPYVAEPAAYPAPEWAMIGMPGGKVPAGQVFVMGDNRNNSADGHVWGTLPIHNIIGHSVFRYWPLDRLGPLAEPHF